MLRSVRLLHLQVSRLVAIRTLRVDSRLILSSPSGWHELGLTITVKGLLW